MKTKILIRVVLVLLVSLNFVLAQHSLNHVKHPSELFDTCVKKNLGDFCSFTGAQRSDSKSGNKNDYPDYFGPQGDIRYVYNYVRCVK